MADAQAAISQTAGPQTARIVPRESDPGYPELVSLAVLFSLEASSRIAVDPTTHILDSGFHDVVCGADFKGPVRGRQGNGAGTVSSVGSWRELHGLVRSSGCLATALATSINQAS